MRIGSKIPAFNPYRILDDPELLDLVDELRPARPLPDGHFDHPRELTEPRGRRPGAAEAGATCVNQCPISRGVNDDDGVLAELFERHRSGVPQYYLFQGRPTAGNEPFEVPLVEGFEIFDRARRRCSGLSRRVRFAMSHASGKIEILGVDAHHIFLRYHRANDPELESRVMVCERDDEAFWFDDLAVLR